MADVTKVVEIKANYSDAIKSMSEYMGTLENLKKREKELTAEIKKNGEATDEQRKELAAVKVAQTEYSKSIRETTKEIQNNISQEKQQEGSLVSLRAALSNTTKEYDNLSRVEREGAKGDALRQKINALTTELKDAEESTQRFYRNVGNYENAINNAISANVPFIAQIQSLIASSGGAANALKTVSSAVVSLGRSLLALAANPVFLVLAGLAAIIMGVKKAISSSEEATNRWNAILAPFNRALSFLMSILQTAAGVVLSVAEGVSTLFGWFSKLLEKLPFVGSAFKEINDANSEAIELAKERADIEKTGRENEVLNAKDALKVAELRKKAKDRENATAQERLAAIQQANKLEEQASKRNVELAERRFNALKKESQWADNDAKTNEELAKAEAAVYNARREYYQKTMELAEQENSVRNEIASEEKARAEGAMAAMKERQEKELAAVRAAEDAMLALVKDSAEQRRAQITVNYARQIEDLKKRLNTEKNLTVRAREAINQTIIALELQKEEELDKLSDENIQKEADRQARIIATRLAAVKAGSEQELQLRLQQIELERQAEIRNAEETGVALVDINAKYDKMISDAKTKAAEDQRKKAVDEMRLEWENKIAEAALQGQDTLQLQLEQRKAELDAIHQLEGESDAEFKARQLEAQQNYVDAKQALADKEVEIEQAKFQAAAEITGALSGLFETLGEDNKAFAMLSKTLALAEIAINTGKAIAAGTASAMSEPFPKNLLAIATTIATVMANINTAIKTVKSAKFADGGLVTGPGSGTSDSIPARLSNGESVNNARSTSMFAPLYSVLNQLGGGAPIASPQAANQAIGEDMLARAVAKGIASMPNPVVSVQEISTVNNRVNVVETLGDV